LLLLTVLGNPAAAAEPTELQTKNPRTAIVVPNTAAETPEPQSQNVRKVLAAQSAVIKTSERTLDTVREISAEPIAVVETPRRQSSNARKLLTLLGTIGVDTRDVRNLVSTVDSRIDKGYLKFSEHQLPGSGGKVMFRYRLNGTVDPVLSASNKHGVRRLELSYKPSENSRWEAVATRKYVVVTYRVPLDKIEW
jgi:hypothetical protein